MFSVSVVVVPLLAIAQMLLLANAQWNWWTWPWSTWPLSSLDQSHQEPLLSANANALAWGDAYSENVARFSAYHGECVDRCDAYFWRLSDWLSAASAAAGGAAPPNLPRNSHRRHTKALDCLSPEAPNGPRHFAKEAAEDASGNNRSQPPLVLPILHGNFSAPNRSEAAEIAGRHLELHPSVTLILDGKATILVDTGLAVHRQAVLAGLLWHGVPPHRVNIVVITHPDAHSMGNLNLFPCAEIYSGSGIFRADRLRQQPAPSFETNRSDLPFRPLSPQTELFLTPSLSLQDQSLIVRNVKDHGTVAIVGKLILDEADLAATNAALLEFGVEDSEHRKLWQATRREVACLADFVVPGYGAPFKVSADLKRLAECHRPAGEKKGGG